MKMEAILVSRIENGLEVSVEGIEELFFDTFFEVAG